jgi:hypothetical protein
VSDESKSVMTLVTELRELIVAYVKQEAIEPIKELGRFVGFGVAGSLFLSIGLVTLTLAGLRALQTETGTMFTGNWSWAPYLITLAGCALVAALAARAISANRRKEPS